MKPARYRSTIFLKIVPALLSFARNGAADTAVPESGFTVIDSILPIGSYVQTAVATKDVTTAGSYHVTWNSGGDEGAQLWLVAVPSASSPILRAQISGGNLVIAWPSSAIGYGLETASHLATSNSWTPVTNAPVIVNSQNTITNALAQPKQFYRLRKGAED